MCIAQRLRHAIGTLMLAVLVLSAGGAGAALVSLDGMSMYLHWELSPRTTLRQSTELTPVIVGPGTELFNYQGMFDIDLFANTAIVTVTNPFTLGPGGVSRGSLNFVFPNAFGGINSFSVTGSGAGPTQTGCCGFMYFWDIQTWLPWTGIDLGGSNAPFAYERGDTFNLTFRLSDQVPAAPPPILLQAPEPSTIVLIAVGSIFGLALASRRRSRVATPNRHH